MCTWSWHTIPLRGYTIAASAFHHEEPVSASWRERRGTVERDRKQKPCAWLHFPAKPVGPSWDLSHGQFLPHPSTHPYLQECTFSPARHNPQARESRSGPQPSLLYKVGGDAWPWFVCLSFFFPQQCSTDPVCLNPLDVTLMDCRGGGWICVLVWRRSFRWEMFDAWSGRAARGKEKGGEWFPPAAVLRAVN